MKMANSGDLKSLKLECPNCGGGLMVVMAENDTLPSVKKPHEVPIGYECVRMSCWAEWDLAGNPTSPSRLAD
jgi:hypothetical protein